MSLYYIASVRGQIEIRGLMKSFDAERPLFRGLDLRVEAGAFVAVLGRSGGGKSTLLRMLADLVGWDHGTITIDGKVPSEVRRHIAFVFQDATLLPWRRVLANVELPLQLAGMDAVTRRERAHHWLKALGLEGWEQHYPRQLSGGMRMRVSLARMLVRDPQLMLLDEPFAALDELNRYRLGELLSELYSRNRWTTLFVTHSVAEAVFLSQRILILGEAGAPPKSFDLPWDFPRRSALRSDPEYAAAVARISGALAETESPAPTPG